MTWTAKPLIEFCDEIEDRCGTRDLPVFSVSKKLGIVLQAERFKKRIASENISRYKVIQPGEFAFDPMLLWSGSIARNTTQTTGVVSPAYCVFRLTKGLDPRFLHLYLTQPERLEYYGSISFGTNERRRKAQFADFVRLQVPVPALTEQQRIVTLLDEADDLRKLRAQVDQNTGALLPALFHEMFGDPENTRFPVKQLAELVLPERPITYGILKPGPDIEGGVPYVRVVDIKQNRLHVGQLHKTTNEIAYQYRRSMLYPGDILVTIRGTVGRTCIVPEELTGANITQDTARVAVTSAVENTYVVEFLNTPWAQNWMNRHMLGQAVKGINLGDLRKLPVPVAPLPLQRDFAQRVVEVRELEAEQAASRRGLDALFQSLLHRAFNGQI